MGFLTANICISIFRLFLYCPVLVTGSFLSLLSFKGMLYTFSTQAHVHGIVRCMSHFLCTGNQEWMDGYGTIGWTVSQARFGI